MRRQKQLTFFTQSYTQAALIFPYLMVSPAYFSGAMQLGGLMQTASAFNSVQNALSYFINIYIELAEYRAVIARLTGFEEAIAAGRAAARDAARGRRRVRRARRCIRRRPSPRAPARRRADCRGRTRRVSAG